MGSDTDYPTMAEAGKTLEKLGIVYEMEVTSAHRSPGRTHEYATSAASRGLKCIIVGAGGAAHLAGVVAAVTTLPVIGVDRCSAGDDAAEWNGLAAGCRADAGRNPGGNDGD